MDPTWAVHSGEGSFAKQTSLETGLGGGDLQGILLLSHEGIIPFEVSS